MLSRGNIGKGGGVDGEVVAVLVVSGIGVGGGRREDEEFGLLWSHLNIILLAVVHSQLEEESKLVEITGC